MTIVAATEEIDRSTPIPLYYQVSQILRKEIESGRYKPGDYIPTEMELQKRFSVSRATIRQAVADLVYQGLLARRRAKGATGSATQYEPRLSDLASFTNEMMNSGFTLRTQVLSFKHIVVPESIADFLGLKTSEMIYAMERLRLVDDKPVSVEKWYASGNVFPGLDRSFFGETGFEQSTYYVLMKRYGVVVNRAVDTVSPLGVESREAKLLKVEPGTPVLLRSRISYGSDNQPVSYAVGVYLIRLRFLLEPSRSHTINR